MRYYQLAICILSRQRTDDRYQKAFVLANGKKRERALLLLYMGIVQRDVKLRVQRCEEENCERKRM